MMTKSVVLLRCKSCASVCAHADLVLKYDGQIPLFCCPKCGTLASEMDQVEPVATIERAPRPSDKLRSIAANPALEPATSFRDSDIPPVQVTFAPTWEEFHRDCKILADKLRNVPCAHMLAILRGGAIAGTILANELEIRKMRTCYQVPDKELLDSNGSGVIVVDDFADTGEKISNIRNLLPEAIFVAPYVKIKAKFYFHAWSREISQDVNLKMPWEVR